MGCELPSGIELMSRAPGYDDVPEDNADNRQHQQPRKDCDASPDRLRCRQRDDRRDSYHEVQIDAHSLVGRTETPTF